jgi:hypothetical protein
MEFLAGYAGAAGYKQALEVVRAVFDLAVEDGLIPHSPVAKVPWRKREKPIRLTPTLTAFQAILESVRTKQWSDTREESADLIEFLGLAEVAAGPPGPFYFSGTASACDEFFFIRRLRPSNSRMMA